MFTLIFRAAILEDQVGPLTRRLHTRLYNFAGNVSTNISTAGQRTHFKLWELSSLFIVYKYYNLLNSSTEWFSINFLLRDNEHSIGLRRWTWMTCLPLHCLPFPWYPFKQEQRYDPLVLIHSAFRWQSWTSSAHSSTSLHDIPSPWKPKLHLQVWEPCVLMQRAFLLHLSVPSLHSSMSKQKWDRSSLVWSLY